MMRHFVIAGHSASEDAHDTGCAVMAGHSASEDARERAYAPAIHLLRKNF